MFNFLNNIFLPILFLIGLVLLICEVIGFTLFTFIPITIILFNYTISFASIILAIGAFLYLIHKVYLWLIK